LANLIQRCAQVAENGSLLSNRGSEFSGAFQDGEETRDRYRGRGNDTAVHGRRVGVEPVGASRGGFQFRLQVVQTRPRGIDRFPERFGGEGPCADPAASPLPRRARTPSAFYGEEQRLLLLNRALLLRVLRQL
jgi:hypothetical protein